jgi:hypothetical protein
LKRLVVEAHMNAAIRSTMLGAGVGAGLMFLLDPAGRRRRSLVRDKLIRTARKTRRGLNATKRDVSNRIEGVAAELPGTLSNDVPDDSTLAERVRAELGRVASHPRAIQVTANHGCVTLSGDILASEARAVVSAVGRVKGVCDVNSALKLHSEDERIPALQGYSPRPGWWSSWLASGWSPTARVVAGTAVAAGVATAFAARR